MAVDPDEIRRLGKRFRKLDLDNSGSLSVDEFMSLPELQQNPLVQRVIEIFDEDGNGEVDFKGQPALLRVASFRRSQQYNFPSTSIAGEVNWFQACSVC